MTDETKRLLDDLETDAGCMRSVSRTLAVFAIEAGKRGDSRTCHGLTGASMACNHGAEVIATLTRELEDAQCVIAVLRCGAIVAKDPRGKGGWIIGTDDQYGNEEVVSVLRPIWNTSYATESEAWAAAWTALRSAGLVEEVTP